MNLTVCFCHSVNDEPSAGSLRRPEVCTVRHDWIQLDSYPEAKP